VFEAICSAVVQDCMQFYHHPSIPGDSTELGLPLPVQSADARSDMIKAENYEIMNHKETYQSKDRRC
jgi:hypothetical protein